MASSSFQPGQAVSEATAQVGRLFRLRYNCMVMYNCHFDRSKQIEFWDDLGRASVIISSVLVSVGFGLTLTAETSAASAAIHSLPTFAKALAVIPMLIPPLQAVYETGAKKAFHKQMGHRYQDLYELVNLTWGKATNLRTAPEEDPRVQEIEAEYTRYAQNKSELDRSAQYLMPDSMYQQVTRTKLRAYVKPEEIQRAHASN